MYSAGVGGMYPALAGAELLVRADDLDEANEALLQHDHSLP